MLEREREREGWPRTEIGHHQTHHRTATLQFQGCPNQQRPMATWGLDYRLSQGEGVWSWGVGLGGGQGTQLCWHDGRVSGPGKASACSSTLHQPPYCLLAPLVFCRIPRRRVSRTALRNSPPSPDTIVHGDKLIAKETEDQSRAVVRLESNLERSRTRPC